MQQSILILAAGGPAPSTNTVISSVSKVFIKSGYGVIGLHDGYKNLFTGKAATLDIDFEFEIFGGTPVSRTKYSRSQNNRQRPSAAR